MNYDLIIIGAGPGGYAAAIRSAALGKKVCLIEKGLIGGTCLNRGCIPTKALVKSVSLLRDIKRARDFGITVNEFKANFNDMQARKTNVVSGLRRGAEAFLRSKGVDIINADAKFCGTDTIEAAGTKIKGSNIIISTGSLSTELKDIKIDHINILSSEDMLDIKNLPESLIIIGGGYIGCEFAFIFNELGCKVRILEMAQQLLPNMDNEIARRIESSLKKAGIEIAKKAIVSSASIDNGVTIKTESGESFTAQKALLCVGRKPDLSGLNLDAAGIKTANNRITVDKRLKTNIPNIYAVGDVTGVSLLAHVASYQGNIAAMNISGEQITADYEAVPSCIFTSPEVASVGITEEEAKKGCPECKAVKLPFSAISKAHVDNETEGIIKVIINAESKKILGAHIIGSAASELIAHFTIAIRNNLTTEQLKQTIYAHPTFSEGISDLMHLF